MRINTEERMVLGPREVRTDDVQKMGGEGVPLSLAQGTEQIKFMGQPGFRVPSGRTCVCVCVGGDW